jgi:hypothetical protein
MHIKKFNKYDTLLVNHTYIPEEIQKISDYCFYDSRNLIWQGENINYKVQYTFDTKDVEVTTFKLNIYIPAVYYLTFPLTFAKSLGYDYAVYIDYDHYLIDDKEIEDCIKIFEEKKYSSIIYSTNNPIIPMYTSFHLYNLKIFDFNLFTQDPEKIKKIYIDEYLNSYESFYYNNFIEPNKPLIKKIINWDDAIKENFNILPGLLNINKSTLSIPFYVLYVFNNKLYFWTINTNKHNVPTYIITGKDLNINIDVNYNIWYNLILCEDINNINKENNFISIKTKDKKLDDFYLLNSDFFNKLNKETTVTKK